MQMRAEMSKWIKRLDFVMLATWFILGIVLVVISFTHYGVDFRGYYAAARVLWEGGNPYDYHLVSQVLLDVTGEMGNNPFYYPPWFAWIFVPLSAIPFDIARAIWLVVNLVLWYVGLWRLNGLLGWSLKGWQLYSLFTLATFSFAWVTWRYEQAGILVFVLLVETMQSIQKRNWVWSGVWLAFLLIKPNISLIVISGLGFWLIRNGKWRVVLVAFLVLVGLLGISTWITPDWYRPFLEDGFGRGLTTVLNGPNQVVAYRINSTMPDWLATLGLNRSSRYVIYGVSLLIGLIVFFSFLWKSPSLFQVTTVSLLASYLLTPYALQYDFPPLVIALFWGLLQSFSSPGGERVGLLVAGFVCSVIFWQQNISWAYWMVIGLAGLCSWGYYQEIRTKPSIPENDL